MDLPGRPRLLYLLCGWQWAFYNIVGSCCVQTVERAGGIYKGMAIENKEPPCSKRMEQWGPLIRELNDHETIAFAADRKRLYLIIQTTRREIENKIRQCPPECSADQLHEAIATILKRAYDENQDLQSFFGPLCDKYPLWCETYYTPMYTPNFPV